MPRVRRDILVVAGPGLALGLCLLLAWAISLNGAAPTSRFTRFHTPVMSTLALGTTGNAAEAKRPETGVSSTLERRAGRPNDTVPPLTESDSLALIKLVDETGAPLANAVVRILQGPNFSLEIADPSLLGWIGETESFTDQSGEVLHAMEARSEYELLVIADGRPAQRFRFRDPGRKVFTVRRGASIGGVITNLSNEPLAGIPVQLWHDGIGMSVATTDARGLYRIDNVPPDDVTIQVASPSWERSVKHLTVEPGNRYARDFRLRRGRHLDVMAVDVDASPVNAAFVRLVELNSGREVGTQRTDRDGMARFDALVPSRQYMVVADHATTGIGRREVAVPADAAASAMTVVRLLTPMVVRGQVASKEGVPAAGAILVFESDLVGNMGSSRHYVSVRAEDDGSFVAEGLDPELRYSVVCYHDQFAIGRHAVVDRLSLELSNGIVNFTLSPPSRVTGAIVNAAGNPVANALVFLAFEDTMGRGIAGSIIGRTDAFGRYSFDNVPGGRIRVEAKSMTDGQSVVPVVLEVAEGSDIDSVVHLDNP